MLIYPRFASLSFNFILAVMVYFIVHFFLHGEINWYDFLGGLHEYSVLGNPTWFILMTLLTYLLTYICYTIVGKYNPILFVFTLIFLLTLAIYLVCQIKPSHWVNTILCFPAGMLYYLKGEAIEKRITQTKVPSIVYAVTLIAGGWIIYQSSIWPAFYTQNIGGILFALGVTWFVGSFKWKSPVRFLVWLGGSGLFVVYMFHLLPMRVMTHLELNHGSPYLVWLTVFFFTSVLVLVTSMAYKKLNQTLFS